MADRNELIFRIGLNSTLGPGLERDGRAVRRFTDQSSGFLARMRGEVGRLNAEINGFSSITRLAAGAGALYKARETLVNSARLDRDLGRIGRTADMSREEVARLRKELWAMSEATGQSRDDLQAAFDDAVQSGLRFKEALPVIGGVNKAVAVTNANAKALAGSLTVAGEAFNFDLSKPGLALELLDKMRVAGGLGKAELEDLADIFARVGVDASSANMSFEKTLAFIEVLSKIEGNRERLGTLAQSTLRLFNNENYRREATKATGVRFFNADKSRRDASDVLADFKARYDSLKTDGERERFISRAFGKTDLDTQKGMRTLLGGDRLDTMNSFTAQIGSAGGVLDRELKGAIDNAIDQAGRLEALMGRAADAFVKPLNSAVTVPLLEGFVDGDATTRTAMLAGAAGLAVAGRMAWKRRRGAGGAADALGEIAGAAGAQRVFVTNWPGGMLGPGDALKQKRDARGGPLFGDGSGAGGTAGRAMSRGARAWGGAKGALKWGAPVAIATGAYDLYDTYTDDSLTPEQKNVQYGSTIGGTGGALAGAAAGAAAGALLGPVGALIGGLLGGAVGAWGGEKIGGEIVLRVQDDRVKVGGLKSDNPDVPISVDTGAYMVAP